MSDTIDIRLCEPAPFLHLGNGQLAMTDGTSVWIVIVTANALKATAHPPDASLRRLVRHAGFYRDLAAATIRRQEDIDGKIWIREADVLAATAPDPGNRTMGTVSPA